MQETVRQYGETVGLSEARREELREAANFELYLFDESTPVTPDNVIAEIVKSNPNLTNAETQYVRNYLFRLLYAA